MSLKNFIGASSAILLAWLGATYFHEVPAERYPNQGKISTVLPTNNVAGSAQAFVNVEINESEDR